MVPDAAWRVAQQLARHLHLGEVQDLAAVDGGLLNRGLVATTVGGRWYFKGSRYRDPDPVVREHEVAAVARRAGVPSPAPVANRDGATVTWAGNRWWVAFPFVDGRHVARNHVDEATATVFGETLGRVHRALDDTPTDLLRRMPVKGAPTPEATLDRIRAFEAEITRRPVVTAFDGHALASLAYRRSVIESDAGQWAGFNLPTGAIHGDFHVGNVRFHNEASTVVNAVLDWELASVAPRALDVARALDLTIDLPTDLASGAPCVRAFAQGYGRYATLGDLATERMASLYRIARTHSLWVYEEHYRLGEAPTDGVAIDDLTTLQWWHRERDAITSTVVDAFASTSTPRVISTRAP